MKQKRNLKIAGWSVLSLLILGSLVFTGYYITQNDPLPPEEIAADAQKQVVDELVQIIEEDEKAKEEQTESGLAEATLESVRDNGNEFGLAQRDTSSGNYELEILASLGDPQPGKFYEGWLVGAGKVISTGKITKETENTFSASYESDIDLSAQTQVVITEETLSDGLDGKPEAHVLEGEFEI